MYKIKNNNVLIILLESSNYELSSINYDLMNQILGHTGKLTNLYSYRIMGEKISNTPSLILQCEDCELEKIIFKISLNKIHVHSPNLEK